MPDYDDYLTGKVKSGTPMSDFEIGDYIFGQLNKDDSRTRSSYKVTPGERIKAFLGLLGTGSFFLSLAILTTTDYHAPTRVKDSPREDHIENVAIPVQRDTLRIELLLNENYRTIAHPRDVVIFKDNSGSLETRMKSGN